MAYNPYCSENHYEIETFQGLTIPLPEQISSLCAEDPSIIYELKVLLQRTQKYLGASPEEKRTTLRHIIFKLRDLTLVYPDLKEIFVDFVVDNAQDDKLNSGFKNAILLDWIERDEEIIRLNRQAEKERSERSSMTVLDHVSNRIGNLMGKVDSFFKLNAS